MLLVQLPHYAIIGNGKCLAIELLGRPSFSIPADNTNVPSYHFSPVGKKNKKQVNNFDRQVEEHEFWPSHLFFPFYYFKYLVIFTTPQLPPAYNIGILMNSFCSCPSSFSAMAVVGSKSLNKRHPFIHFDPASLDSTWSQGKTKIKIFFLRFPFLLFFVSSNKCSGVYPSVCVQCRSRDWHD